MLYTGEQPSILLTSSSIRKSLTLFLYFISATALLMFMYSFDGNIHWTAFDPVT